MIKHPNNNLLQFKNTRHDDVSNVEKNLKDVLDAYSKRDKDIAYRVWNSDLEIDKLVNFSMDELLKFMKSNDIEILCFV